VVAETKEAAVANNLNLLPAERRNNSRNHSPPHGTRAAVAVVAAEVSSPLRASEMAAAVETKVVEAASNLSRLLADKHNSSPSLSLLQGTKAVVVVAVVFRRLRTEEAVTRAVEAAEAASSLNLLPADKPNSNRSRSLLPDREAVTTAVVTRAVEVASSRSLLPADKHNSSPSLNPQGLAGTMAGTTAEAVVNNNPSLRGTTVEAAVNSSLSPQELAGAVEAVVNNSPNPQGEVVTAVAAVVVVVVVEAAAVPLAEATAKTTALPPSLRLQNPQSVRLLFPLSKITAHS